jgi:chorismate mutase/prephenate dehydratase
MSIDEPRASSTVDNRVAYLGPAGTFTHAAARELFGPYDHYAGAATIKGVFEAVRAGQVGCGVIPIENSTEGSVTEAVDALIDSDLLIRGELVTRIDQCLLSTAANMSDIKRVYSHPQALAQCRGWLATHLDGVQLVHTVSTSAATREALADSEGAAIGSRLAAELHALPLLREGIQDLSNNATRFVVLSTEDAARTGDDKTTLAFAIRDARGALLRVLEVFDSHDINLTRIESRPSRQKAWDYVFLVDLAGHRRDDNVRGATEILGERCPMLKHLGSYPRALDPFD